MGNFFDILQSAYESAYSYGVTKQYIKPKIYHGGDSFDLKKRWYVYYSFIDPDTGKMKRQTSITLNVNRNYKTKKERLFHLKIVRDALEEMLKKGFSPYQDKADFDNLKYSANDALDFALALKKNTLKATSFRDYENRLSHFKRFLDKKGLLTSSIHHVDKKAVNGFLNEILSASSARNRNNTRVVLSALFGILEDNDIIPRNFIKNIKNLKTTPTRNKTYSLEKVDEIYSYLEKHDPLLLLFIKFVSYNFLRPIEVCRLQVKDLELSSTPPVLKVRAKNKAVKTKIIPDVMMAELQRLDLSNPEAFLFTHTGVSETETSADDRRGYFTRRYKKVKETLKLGKDYTIYSFRHTFITRLYQQMRKTLTPFETKSKLMLITGHSTMTALEKYLRDIDAELPEDYSDLLK